MYKPYPLILWLSLVAIIVNIDPLSAQTTEDAWALYNKHQFNAAHQAGLNILSKEKTSYVAFLIIGRSLVGEGKYTQAMEYLEKVLKAPDAPTYSKAFALNDLGLCYFYKQDYIMSKQVLKQSYQLNATKNATDLASRYQRILGFDETFSTWITKEIQHFVFHFQDTVSAGHINVFMQRKENAFNNINTFFGAALPKKIDYFVWSKPEEAELFLKKNLAFTQPLLCLTHTTYRHTLGHEMTHSISYYAAPSDRKNQLISEGVGVYFDQDPKDNMKILKTSIKNPVSIVDIWKNTEKAESKIVYPLGAELVKRLIGAFGKQKFIEFLANQSYDNAKKVFGSELTEVISKLQNELAN